MLKVTVLVSSTLKKYNFAPKTDPNLKDWFLKACEVGQTLFNMKCCHMISTTSCLDLDSSVNSLGLGVLLIFK